MSPAIPGLAIPGTFPSRGFSPPQGFAPHSPLRPFFMPPPPIGFPPSELSPPNQPRPSPAPYPLDIAPLSESSPLRPMVADLPTLKCWPLRAHPFLFGSWLRCLLGFAPAQRPFNSTEGLVLSSADALMAFPPSKALHPPDLCHLSCLPLHLLSKVFGLLSKRFIPS